MPRRGTVVVAFVGLVLLVGVTVFLVTRPPAAPQAAPRADADSPTPSPLPTQAPSVKTRPARVLGVDDAIRELDLIRPSRQKVADDFTLPTPGGAPFRLAEHRGKIVFVNFWATWCDPCREEMPAMERLWAKHRRDAFIMVAVSLDTNPKVVPPFVAKHGLTFPIALDPKMEVANTYGVRALPSSFIIDRDGRMAALALGPRAWDNSASHSLIQGMGR